MASQAEHQARIDELEGLVSTLTESLIYYADETNYDKDESPESPIEIDRGKVARDAIEEVASTAPLSEKVARLESVVAQMGEDLSHVARIQRKELAKELSWEMLDPDLRQE